MKVVGAVDTTNLKGGFPHELSGMIVLEKPHGKRMMIRANMIRMIEESESLKN